MDGQHKLIRWKFVIHGGGDGYSRVCVFMHAGDNNRAETVEQLFLEATQEWGWPQRVRAHYGGENNGIWSQMLAVRGTLLRIPSIKSIYRVLFFAGHNRGFSSEANRPVTHLLRGSGRKRERNSPKNTPERSHT